MAALLLLLLGIPAASHAADIAPEPVPTDVIEWVEEFATSEELMSDFNRGEHLDALGIDAIDTIGLGRPVPAYRWDVSFVRGETSGLDGIVTLNEWTVLVSINGEAAGTIEVVNDGSDGRPEYVGGGVPVRDAGSLESVGPDEFFVDEGPIGAWFAVSTDHQVRGLNFQGLREVPEPISLSEYAQRTVERYAEDMRLAREAESSWRFGMSKPTSTLVLVAVVGGSVAAALTSGLLHRRRAGGGTSVRPPGSASKGRDGTPTP